jgi:tetratricopeptide (TPR) repeat protein
VAHRYLVPALRHYLVARDLCPLMAKPHVRLGASVEWLQGAEPRSVYLRRAKRVLPRNAELWYLVGTLELLDHQDDKAWKSWRRSLELSQVYLPPILKRATAKLGALAVLDKVLPDRPEVLLAAADHLYPDRDADERRPFLLKARALLDARPASLTPAEIYFRAQLEVALGDPSAALRSYQDALAQAPDQVTWRFEYARLLRKQGRIEEAHRQVLTVLQQQPGHTEALQLLKQVAHDLAESG